MSDFVKLNVSERDNTLNPRQLRDAGFVPATLYGKGATPQNIQVKNHEFVMLYRKGNRIFQLTGPGIDVTARAKQVQATPVKLDVLNIEFLLLSPEDIACAKQSQAAEACQV